MSKINEQKLLSEINEKLGILIVLTAMNISTNKEIDTSQKVKMLTKAGLTSTEIGEILGIHPDTVRHLRSEKKKKERGLSHDKVS